MFVAIAVVVVYMCCCNKVEIAGHSLEVTMSAIVTNSDVGQLRGAPEFLNAFDGGDVVRNVFHHQVDAGKLPDLKDCSVGILERDRGEGVSGIAEMHHHVVRPDAIGKLETSLHLVDSGLPLAAFR